MPKEQTGKEGQREGLLSAGWAQRGKDARGSGLQPHSPAAFPLSEWLRLVCSESGCRQARLNCTITPHSALVWPAHAGPPEGGPRSSFSLGTQMQTGEIGFDQGFTHNWLRRPK